MEHKEIKIEQPEYFPWLTKEQLIWSALEIHYLQQEIKARKLFASNPTPENKLKVEVAESNYEMHVKQSIEVERVLHYQEAEKMTNNIAKEDAQDLAMMEQNYEIFFKILTEYEAKHTNQHIKNMLLKAQKAQTPEQRLEAYKGMKMAIENWKLIK